MRVECLQSHTGSCLGCNVLEIVNKQAYESGSHRQLEEIMRIAAQIKKDYCPEGKSMIVPHPAKSSIW